MCRNITVIRWTPCALDELGLDPRGAEFAVKGRNFMTDLVCKPVIILAVGLRRAQEAHKPRCPAWVG